MYKLDKFIFTILIAIGCFFSFFLGLKFPCDFVSNLITFVSIIMGFQMSAFTMLFSSKLVKDLYNIKDIENSTITLKHRLKNYFKTSFNCSLISVLVLLLCNININMKILGYNFILNSSYFFCSIIFANIFCFCRLNYFLYKIFIQDHSSFN